MATKIGPCLLIILTTIWITNGFSTKKCDHNQLSDQLEKFVSCLDWEFLELVDELLMDYKSQVKATNNSYDLKNGCPVLQKHADHVEKCAVSLTSSCLNDKTTDIVKFLFEYVCILCENVEYAIHPVRDPSLLPKKVKDWGAKSERMLDTNPWLQDPLAALISLVKPDKKCNERKSGVVLMNMQSCWITSSRARMDPFGKNPIPQDVAICSRLNYISESCGVENDCFSSQEMELIKKSTWRIYSMLMNTAVKIKDSFGGSNKAIDAIAKTSFMSGNEKFFGPLNSEIVNFKKDKSTYGMIADRAIDDFENKKCKETVSKQIAGTETKTGTTRT